MRLLPSPSVSLAVCIIALLSCKQEGSDKSESADSTRKAEASEKETHARAKIASVKPQELKPGPAFLAVKDTGIVMLDGTKVTTVQPLRFSVQDMVYGPDGAVWVSAVSGVYRIQGKESTQVRSSGGLQNLAVVSEKEAYGVNYKGVHHYTGTSWSVEDKAKLGVTLLRDIEVDKSGNLWVISSNALHTKRKGSSEWSEVDVSAEVGKKPFFKQLAKGPDGTLYATVSQGLLRLRSGKWKKVAGDFGLTGTNHLDVGPTGLVAALSGTKTLHVLGPKGDTQIDSKSAHLEADSFTNLAIDGSNRIWLATDNGLLVMDRKGKQIAHWPPATLEGVTGDITHIVVTGTGPADLPEPTAPATGTVKGKVLQAGTPTANAEIELCNSPSMLFKTTPCSDKPFTKTTKTGAGGEFTIPEVPIASYGFAVKTPGQKWMITMSSQCCTKMKKGQQYDIGAIQLK